MYNRCILILLLFICTACLDERSSPDRSAEEAVPKTETSHETKDNNKNDEGSTVNETESCALYPTKYNQPNWNMYFETYSSLVKGSSADKLLSLHVRHMNQEKIFNLIYNKVTWFSDKEFSWIEKVETILPQIVDTCNYPEVQRIQLGADNIIFVVDEWRTSEFYQPRHVIFWSKNKTNVWIDEFTGSKFINIGLYREVLSDEEQKIFLRRRYGNFPLNITSGSNNLNSISDMQLMMTNRTNAYVGNLVLKYDDGSISSQLGPIEAFKIWDENTLNYKYLIEFGAAAPTFVGDTDNIRTTKAGGNFDKKSSRIRLIFEKNVANKDLPFIGEYIQSGFEKKWIHFTGVRPARVESFE